MIWLFHESYSVRVILGPHITAVEGCVCIRAVARKVSWQVATVLHALEAPVLSFVRVLR